MDVDSEPSQSQFTILRIKRKRNEEPLDALVIESRLPRKRSRGIGVFQFAQTVEDEAWNDANRAKDIQEQVSRLAREAPVVPENKPDLGNQATATFMAERAKEERYRYTILNRDENEISERKTRRLPTHPPKVVAAKDLPPPGSIPEIKMFDAVREADKTPSSPMDPEMAKFIPLLNDYLKINDVKLDSGATKSNPNTEDDYVWDVFYHRPATLSEWNQAANVGTLSGVTASMINVYDSASDSEEEEDAADEDSNDEGYYKNDYPDEESSPEEEESDEFHESSDMEDVVRYDEDGADDDWR